MTIQITVYSQDTVFIICCVDPCGSILNSVSEYFNFFPPNYVVKPFHFETFHLADNK